MALLRIDDDDDDDDDDDGGCTRNLRLWCSLSINFDLHLLMTSTLFSTCTFHLPPFALMLFGGPCPSSLFPSDLHSSVVMQCFSLFLCCIIDPVPSSHV